MQIKYIRILNFIFCSKINNIKEENEIKIDKYI